MPNLYENNQHEEKIEVPVNIDTYSSGIIVMLGTISYFLATAVRLKLQKKAYEKKML